MGKNLEELKKSVREMHNIPLESRHIRWNWEPSPDNYDFNHKLLRYNLFIVDDSDFDRRNRLNKIFGQLSRVDSRIVPVNQFEGKIKNSKWTGLLSIYDSIVSSDFLNLKQLGIPIRKDDKMYAREFISIQEYISNLYDINIFRQVS